jgi:hypothetical protein
VEVDLRCNGRTIKVDKLKVGFIGLLKMGEGMVKNLLIAGSDTIVSERSHCVKKRIFSRSRKCE